MAAPLLLVERVLAHVISPNDDTVVCHNNLPSNDVLCPVNVNLRRWTDIVTYIEDITSPVNDRYSNVHGDITSSVDGQISIRTSKTLQLQSMTDIVTYMETLQVQSMTDIVTYMETLQVQSMLTFVNGQI